MELHKIRQEASLYSLSYLLHHQKMIFHANIFNERKRKTQNSKEIFSKKVVNSDSKTSCIFSVPSCMSLQVVCIPKLYF